MIRRDGKLYKRVGGRLVLVTDQRPRDTVGNVVDAGGGEEDEGYEYLEDDAHADDDVKEDVTKRDGGSVKILMYGHRGWIGSMFVDILEKSDRVKYVLGKSRVDDVESVEKELDQTNATHVVTFTGRTHGTHNGETFTTIDYLEQKGKIMENVRDNLFGPVALALVCRDRGVHYTYLGTGCIFSYIRGKESKGFTESDKPNFFGSSYSVVKGFTDRLMHQFESSVLNIRIRMPIVGYDCPRNFITKIKYYAKVCSIPNSMTVLPDLLPRVLDFMLRGMTGTINLTNPGTISHNEILSLYKKHVDPSFTWENFSVQEQNAILASERSNNLLDTGRLEDLGPVLHIRDSVERLMKSYKVDPSLERQDSSFMNDRPSTVVLITGGAGFIGSNFVNCLHRRTKKLRILNLDALYYAGRVDNVGADVRASDRYTFIHGNLQSVDLLRYIFQCNKITHVVHMAAQSHVQHSFSDALRYTNDNVVGTHNLLEACRRHCPTLKRFVHVSTDEVYGQSLLKSDEKQKCEKSILCPTNPYAATKAAAEMIAQSYVHSFKMPIIITRGNNVYGPNQYPEKLVPKFIQLLMDDKPVTIQGDGSCVRGFLHVEDTCAAFMCVLKRGSLGEIYNIGCDSEKMEKSVLDIAKMLIARIKPGDKPEKWITYIPDRPFNDLRYFISDQKLKRLGWAPKISLEHGLDMLVREAAKRRSERGVGV